MKKKWEHVLLAILIIGCFLWIGILGKTLLYHRSRPLSSFELQEKYANQLEKNLLDLLEPATGVGNVRASVHAEIRHQNTTQTQFDFKNATRTVIHEKGPVLVAQSVSVLINENDKRKLASYQNLVKAAIGFDAERGDHLAIEILPFVKVPLWTLGLTPIHLMRIGAGLILIILVGMFWLIKEWGKTTKNKQARVYLPDEELWHEVERISSEKLATLFKEKRPELTAFILYRFPKEKSTEVIELLPKEYMNQITIHLDYIEKLSPVDKSFLLQKTEICLHEILQTIHRSNSTITDISFDSLKNWNDDDLQRLLCYVSKKDLLKALQTASLPVQQALSRNIPPALWQNLIHQAKQFPCTREESLEAQNKITHLAELLKEDV